MTPAANPVRLAATARLTAGDGAAALLAAGVGAGDSRPPGAGGVTTSPDDAPAFPYVEVQGTTEVEGLRSDRTRSSSVTLTLVCRSTSRAEVEAVARVVTELLGRRFALGGELQMTGASVDLYGPAYRENPPGARPWSLPVRLRYTVYQSADPGE